MLDGQIAEHAEALPLDTLIAIVGRVALKDGQPDADERWKRYNDLLPKLRQAMNLPEGAALPVGTRRGSSHGVNCQRGCQLANGG